MGDGSFHTFDEYPFNWSPSLTPAQQRVAVQAAFDSGLVNFLMPVGAAVETDGVPLVVQKAKVNLIGGGHDTTNTATAASMFRTSMPGDLIHVLANDCHFTGFHLHSDAVGGTAGSGIVVGDGTQQVFGTQFDEIGTGSNLEYGIHLQSSQQAKIEGCHLWGWDSALRVENPSAPDGGDNEVGASWLYSAGPNGAGCRHTSGGGLYFTGAKFLFGLNGYYCDWNIGGSGGVSFVNCSIETTGAIGADFRGEFLFERAWFVGTTIAVPSACIAIRNFSAINWLTDLLVSGCTLKGMSSSALIDIGCTANAFIAGNIFNGNNQAGSAIITRAGSAGSGQSVGAIGVNRIIDCGSPPIITDGVQLPWPQLPQL